MLYLTRLALLRSLTDQSFHCVVQSNQRLVYGYLTHTPGFVMDRFLTASFCAHHRQGESISEFGPKPTASWPATDAAQENPIGDQLA